MNPQSPGSPAIRLDWWRLALVLLIIAAIPVGLLYLSDTYRRNPVVARSMVIFIVSVLSFITQRWAFLRAQVKADRFLIDEYRKDPVRYILGPVWILRVWILSTTALMVAFIFYSTARG
jgi:hypothetical protein